MTDFLTKVQLQSILATMRKVQVLPRVIQSEEEAQKFTESDPAGRVWFAGEEYYVAMRAHQ